MNWFLIALLPPALWSVSNHLDKYLISKYIKGGGVGALMIFSSIIGLFLLPFIYVFHPAVFAIKPVTAALIALNAFLYVMASLPYFYALKRDEASIVVPLFQMIPVMSFVVSYIILHETLTTNQLIGGSLIMLGAIGITLELAPGSQVKFKTEVFWYMVLASLLYSLNFAFFKFFALESNFWITSFWEYIGFGIFAFLLFVFVKPYRKEFLAVLNENKVPVLGLNSLNEIVNIVAKIIFNFASLAAPVTLIWMVNGLQPLFVFIYGLILTLFFPHISKEKISHRHLVQKIASIGIMFAGTFLIK